MVRYFVTKMASRHIPIFLLSTVLLILAWSGVAPKDRFTWILETAPVFIGLVILVLTRKRFPLTHLLYTLLATHAAILCLGGHYTYAEVPIGFWVQELFHFSRNHYDRLGHFAQGFFPAILAREILIRNEVVKRGWLFFVVCSICLAFSAFYELIEWWTAMATGEAASAFLGTQGDVWDSQWDMCWALIGSILAQLILSRIHDHAIARIGGVDEKSH